MVYKERMGEEDYKAWFPKELYIIDTDSSWDGKRIS